MNSKAELFVDSRCELGEGPFWNPLLERMFWFDILNQTMLSAGTDGHIVDRITFKDTVSAGAVIDKDSLAVAQVGRPAPLRLCDRHHLGDRRNRRQRADQSHQ